MPRPVPPVCVRAAAGGSPCWETTSVRLSNWRSAPKSKADRVDGDHEGHIRLWDSVARREVAVLRGDVEHPGARRSVPTGRGWLREACTVGQPKDWFVVPEPYRELFSRSGLPETNCLVGGPGGEAFAVGL